MKVNNYLRTLDFHDDEEKAWYGAPQLMYLDNGHQIGLDSSTICADVVRRGVVTQSIDTGLSYLPTWGLSAWKEPIPQWYMHRRLAGRWNKVWVAARLPKSSR